MDESSEERQAFEVDPRFEVSLASEEEFPDIACPIQMRWDMGRMWVSCSTTYPMCIQVSHQTIKLLS